MDGADPARIGPNAITRIAEALIAARGSAETVFRRAGLEYYLTTPPEGMVDEREVIALQQALRAELDAAASAAIARDAGLRTGDYLLAHRVPQGAQRILRVLPPAPAARVLLRAVGKHAWTFAGSGDFSFEGRAPVRVTIAGCPICRGASTDHPVCDYYTAVFERLFTTLVSPRTRVREIQCQAMGADACIFEMDWRGR